MLNEIRDNSGHFKDRGSLTSIMVLDGGALNFNYAKLEEQFMTNMDSVAD